MIEDLPKGKSIGAMQASLQWISTHTMRFIGAVMITTDGGEGFILIKKGTPEAYYFQQGSKILRGKPAFDYYSTHDLLTFRLQKYTAEEYRKAFARYNGEHGSELTPASLDADIPAISVKPSPDIPRTPTPPEHGVKVVAYPAEQETIAEDDVEAPPEESQEFVPDVRKILQSAEESLDFSTTISGMTEIEAIDETAGSAEDMAESHEEADIEARQSPHAPDPSEQQVAPEKSEDTAESHEQPAMEEGPYPPATASAEQETATEEKDGSAEDTEPFTPSPLLRTPPIEDSEVADLGWILRRNGVLAASVFSDGFSVVALGDADFEAVAAIAEDALRSAESIAATLDMGAFVQMTIQMKGKNVIIAPWRDTHICFLTSPKTHLGQIRGILQELALRNSQQGS
jgi:predicted regulator of Ras-like GTPase activity (Roadblock/LC7/MglB family)